MQIIIKSLFQKGLTHRSHILWMECIIFLFCFLFDNFCIFAGVVHHFEEHSSVLDQFVRLSDFFDSAFAHHYHFVVVGNRIQSMGDRYDGGVCELRSDDLLDEIIGFHVYVRRCLIQNQYFVLSEEGACHTKQLSLSHRKCLRCIRNISI